MTIALAALAGMLLAAGLTDLAAVIEARRTTARVASARGSTTSAPGGSRTARGRSRTARGGSRAARGVAMLARLGRRLGVPAPPGELDARLAAAGLGSAVRTADAMAVKGGAGAAVALAAAPALAALPLRMTIVALPAVAAAGFFAPDLWLARRAGRRAARAGVELADVLDLLRVAIVAGLPVSRALTEVGRRRGGLVATELRIVSERLALGVPRADALAALRRSLPLPAIGLLTAAIARADRHGAPLAPALTALAQAARADRTRALHEQAARAAPRIQLAVALLLVPAVLLVVAAGLVHGLA
ncbi:type II secretion system F family protein [Baekduia sp.]|uniref:type II secretion system F family protein n=1 Tax=Baekduia sp. TaxID=2600305 RepID=UPI002E05E9FE|nr:type II secretion system F family protein [Baekduia sp.]